MRNTSSDTYSYCYSYRYVYFNGYAYCYRGAEVYADAQTASNTAVSSLIFSGIRGTREFSDGAAPPTPGRVSEILRPTPAADKSEEGPITSFDEKITKKVLTFFCGFH